MNNKQTPMQPPTTTFRARLQAAQHAHSSLLCVGLDPDASKLPAPFQWSQQPQRSHSQTAQAIGDFLCAVVDATHDLVCAYKPNWAFFEQYGIEGWRALERVTAHIRQTAPTLAIIADAKRGDIGNTAQAYATAVFETFDSDAVTVAPYMGRDSVQPFLDYASKHTFLLALTSNAGAADFQRLRLARHEEFLYEHVLRTASQWAAPEHGGHDNLGFVVGATHPHDLAHARTLAPTAVLLIPGVGAQGGDAQATLAANGSAPAIVNASRSVLYASSGADFAECARHAAQELQRELRVG
jgi:orotidine-5'-phosphate decarboxylase